MDVIAPYIQKIAIMALPLVLAITVHEAAHGYVAYKLGDPTAKRLNRLTLNPLYHVDLMGTVIFPLMQLLFTGSILFGWAKPVPVSPGAFLKPRKGMMWVALAGPVSNLLQAIIAALIIHAILFFYPNFPLIILDGPQSLMQGILVPIFLMSVFAVIINGVLMAFNLIPIPPLDGSRILGGILPQEAAEKYGQLEKYGFVILMGIVFLLPGLLSVVIQPILAILLIVLNIQPSWLSLLP